MKNQWKTFHELKKQQEKQLRHIIRYAYEKVPYYHRLMKQLKVSPSDIKKIEDLKKLPILTKETIKNHWEMFKPIDLHKIEYYQFSTGGSTGTPFRYRIDKKSRLLSWLLLYRGWSYGGYSPGQQILFIGGTSIGKDSVIQHIKDKLRNFIRISAFDMSDDALERYLTIINRKKPKFWYGYATSIYFLLKWVKINNKELSYSPKAIFTTAEKLHKPMRKLIEEVSGSSVFDQYGLNDGGVSAMECEEHMGLHISTERAIMEIVDKDGEPLDEGTGTIIATDLYNKSLPFIRYNTGDRGNLLPSDFSCPCGRGSRMLKEIIGREEDMLITPTGRYIHGEFITHIFWELPEVKKFRIIQKRKDKISILIEPEDTFNYEKVSQVIKNRLRNANINWEIEIKLTKSIKSANKHKFIINKLFERDV